VLSLRLPDSQPRSILCLGAHCDDIEIGCGGTLLRLAENDSESHLHCAVFSGNDSRQNESRKCLAKLFPQDRLHLHFFDFRDGYFPTSWSEIKDIVESLKPSIAPDLVFTHRRSDRHQDHRLLGELTWNTFRNHLIFEYEIVKFEGDLATPNCYIPLTAEQLAQKTQALHDCYLSQRSRTWFSEETFNALARIRGVESASPSGYAEGFHADKFMLGL